MKLTGELRDKLDNAETKEEKKDIIAQAGLELTDDELAGVTGGKMYWYSKSMVCLFCGHKEDEVKPGIEYGIMYECPKCQKTMFTMQGEQYDDEW